MLWVVGICLLLLVIWDAFVTVFSTSGGGPITSFATQRLWQVLLWIHRRKSIHPVLALTGPAMLLGNIVFWYVAQGVAWMLIFVSQPGSVVNSTNQKPANPAETVYFVGTTISSLGYGDFVPAAGPWTMASSVACFFSTVILTVSLSYVLSVLNAAIEQKVLAQQVFALGHSVEEVGSNARLGDSNDSLKNHVLAITTSIDAYAHKHLTYPILHYFHSPRKDRSPARATLLFADTFALLEHTTDSSLRPPPGLQHVVESSLENYLVLTDTQVQPHSSVAPEPMNLLEAAPRVGVDPQREELRSALSDYAVTRQKLLVHCRQDGW